MSSAKLSEVLSDLAAEDKAEPLTLERLLIILGDRALAAMIFLFALPNIFPTPPGTSAIFGAPLVLLTAQYCIGGAPWLPKFMRTKGIPRPTFEAIANRAVPWLRKAERLLQPRLSWTDSALFQRCVGAVCLILAIIVLLPIPLGNMLPAFAICMMSLGLLEKDGVWIVSGLVVAIASIVFVWGVIYAALKVAALLLNKTFSGMDLR